MLATPELPTKIVRLTEVLLHDGWRAIGTGSDDLPAFWSFAVDGSRSDFRNPLAVSHQFIEAVTDQLYFVRAEHVYAVRGTEEPAK